MTMSATRTGTNKRDNTDSSDVSVALPRSVSGGMCAVARSCRHEVVANGCRGALTAADRPSADPRPRTTRSFDPDVVLRRAVATDQRQSVPIVADLHCGHIRAHLENRRFPDDRQRAHFKIYRPEHRPTAASIIGRDLGRDALVGCRRGDLVCQCSMPRPCGRQHCLYLRREPHQHGPVRSGGQAAICAVASCKAG